MKLKSITLNGKTYDSFNVNQPDAFDGYDRFYDNIVRGQVNPTESQFIETYDGSNQLTHPCVRYFPDGWCGHKFWMAYTPYPYSALDLENPCLAFSDDGVNWSSEGILNPLDEPLFTESGEQASMNSDVHFLVRPDGVMEVWWRTNYWENSGDKANKMMVYRCTSTDGSHWSEKEELFCIAPEDGIDCVCPVAIYEDNIYKIWFASGFKCIKYYESITGKIEDLRDAQDINVDNPDYPTHKIWHFDINHTEKGYEFVGCYRPEDNPRDNRYVYYAVSDDNKTYSDRVLILTTGHKDSFDGLQLYRPTIIRMDNKVRVYYGCQDSTAAWSVGMIEAPSPYLFNAVLRAGKRTRSLEYRLGALESRTYANGDLTVVENFEVSAWELGYWKPDENGVLEVKDKMSHSQLIPLASLMDNGAMRIVKVASVVKNYPVVRVNYFDGNCKWIGADINDVDDNNFNLPVTVTWPENAAYFAISANTDDKSDISVLTVTDSFDTSTWKKGYWAPEQNGEFGASASMHHSQLIPLNSLMDGGKIRDVKVSSSVEAWPLVRVNYFDSDGNWIGFDANEPSNSTLPVQIGIDMPENAVYFAISANAADKSMITISNG